MTVNVSVFDYDYETDGGFPIYFPIMEDISFAIDTSSALQEDDCSFRNATVASTVRCSYMYIELSIYYRILQTDSSCVNQTACSTQVRTLSYH